MTLWETTVNPWSLHHHHPGPGVVDVEAVRGPQMDPQFHHTLLQDQPKLQKHMENQGSAGVGVADIHSRPVRNRAGAESRKTWAARHRHPPPYPMEQVLPKTPASLRSGKPAAEELQPNPKNKHRRTHKKGQPQVKGHQKHQHFTAAQNLTRHGRHHGTTTAPARDGSRKGRRVSHFRYNCKRYQRGCLRLARGLAFFFSFLSFLN